MMKNFKYGLAGAAALGAVIVCSGSAGCASLLVAAETSVALRLAGLRLAALVT